MTGICGGLSRPWQRLGNVRQGFPATELVTTPAFPGGTAAAPLAQDVSQLSETGSSTALIRRGGLLGIVRRRDRRDLRRGVPPACPWRNMRFFTPLFAVLLPYISGDLYCRRYRRVVKSASFFLIPGHFVVWYTGKVPYYPYLVPLIK